MKIPIFTIQFLLILTFVTAAFCAGLAWMNRKVTTANQLAKAAQLRSESIQTELKRVDGLRRALRNGERARFASATAKSVGLGKIEGEVELTVRSREEENYVTSTYSFFFRTRDDVELTHNGWNLQVSPEGNFTTEMGLYDFGQIVDLGPAPMSAINILPNSAPNLDRTKDPKQWFFNSAACEAVKKGDVQTKIVEGHSYVLRQVSGKEYVVAGFHVKAYEPGRKVVLDQMEVFAKARLDWIPYRVK